MSGICLRLELVSEGDSIVDICGPGELGYWDDDLRATLSPFIKNACCLDTLLWTERSRDPSPLVSASFNIRFLN